MGLIAYFAIKFRLCIQAHYGGEDYLSWAWKHYFGGITHRYLNFANHIYNTHTLPSSKRYPPGYPIFLFICKLLFGNNLQAYRTVQVVIDGLIVFPLYLLLRGLQIKPAYALLGSVIYAFFPIWAIHSSFLLAEWISPLIFITSCLFLVYSMRSQSKLKYTYLILCGFTIAFGAMFRPDLILLILPFTLLIVIKRKNFPKLTASIIVTPAN